MSTMLLPSPIQIAPPVGTATLPIVELERRAVEADRKQIRLRKGSKKRQQANCSFGNYSDTLTIEAWPFFHAAKKTELTTSFTTAAVDRRALCFAAEHEDLFIWNAGNLRKIDRSVFAMEDFSQSGLAGRFGEAVAYLTMVEWGYVYWDRIAVLWERAAQQSGMTQPEMVKAANVLAAKVASKRPDQEPDFAFEHSNGDVALMESKGSFVHPINDDPSVKDDLRQALKQLNAWTGMIAPAPNKSYAIGTYFRERSDATGDESLIAYVDPPGDLSGDIPPVEFPSDLIRRGNYGAWLVGMGFAESGNALRNRRSGYETAEQALPVARIRGREFALTFQGAVIKRSAKRRYPLVLPWIGPWLDDPLLDWRLLRHSGLSAIVVLGIAVDVLNAIQDTLAKRHFDALLSLKPSIAPDDQSVNDGFTGSIMPDDTIMGQIDPELLTEVSVRGFRL